MKKIITGLVCLLLVTFGLGIWAGITMEKHNSHNLTVSKQSAGEFKLVEQAWNLTQENYVDKTATQPKRLAYATIGGMIDSLGDTGHSTFLTPEEMTQENDSLKGQLEGIGIEVKEQNSSIVVVAAIDGSPAQKAGLRSGDIILKVDGQSIIGLADAVQRIRGPAGTSVTITILTASGETKDMTLVRAKINIPSISWNQLPGTSIIDLRIASFDNTNTRELDAALSAIKPLNPSGIILDLRDNPGGILNEAVGAASRFLKSGNVLLEKDAKGKITPVRVISGVPTTNLPMIILVNEGTASGAEIVAGALHDAGRAKLVGETTFGTGTVLGEFSLSDGSGLFLAMQEWLTPSGKTIWHVGITPDMAVSLAADATPLFPGAEQGMTAEQLESSADQQLLTALKLLSQTQ
jgi:carboxyl-terminal processing protease